MSQYIVISEDSTKYGDRQLNMPIELEDLQPDTIKRSDLY